MTLYVVRRATAAPDLEWVAEIEVDSHRVGELRHKGGLEGQVDPITGPVTFYAIVEAFASEGYTVDEIPPP